MSMMIEQYNGFNFERKSTAVDAYGRTVGVNVARLEPGHPGFGRAIRIEEGVSNLIPIDKQRFEGWTAYQGATITLTQNVTVHEWNTDKATRVQLSGGSHILKMYLRYVSLTASGTNYNTNVRVKNTGSTTVRLCSTISPTAIYVDIAPNETKTVSFTVLGDGVAEGQIQIRAINSSDNLDFIAYAPQVTPTAYPLTFTPSYRAPEIVTVPTYVKDDLNKTNLLSENQANGGEDGTTTGFSQYSGGVTTITRHTSGAWQGSSCIKIVTDGASPNQGIFLPQVPAKKATSFTATVRIRADAPTEQYVEINERNASGQSVGTTTTNAQVTTEWQTFTVTRAITDAANSMIVRINAKGTQAVTIYVDGLQLEEGSRAGSWVPGGHRRLLDATQGEIGFMVYIDAVARRQVAGQYPALFTLNRGNGGRAMYVLHDPTATNWLFTSRDDGDVASALATIADSYLSDGWHRVVVIWDATTLKLFIDGVLRATIANPKLPSWLGLLYLGSQNGTINFLNTLFDDLYFRSEPRTDAEIAIDPLKPWVADAKTTHHVKFDHASKRYYPTRTQI